MLRLYFQDFIFRELRKVGVYSDNEGAASGSPLHGAVNLVACSSQRGFVFIADPSANTLTVIQSSFVYNLGFPTSGNQKELVTDVPKRCFQLSGRPSFLQCNHNGTKLAVVIEKSATVIAQIFSGFEKQVCFLLFCVFWENLLPIRPVS